MDPPRIEVHSLVVLVAEQVAAHIPEKRHLKLSPLYVGLIRVTGIKRKENVRKGEWSPTPAQI